MREVGTPDRGRWESLIGGGGNVSRKRGEHLLAMRGMPDLLIPVPEWQTAAPAWKAAPDWQIWWRMGEEENTCSADAAATGEAKKPDRGRRECQQKTRGTSVGDAGDARFTDSCA